MEKRDKIYKILGMTIGTQFVILYILNRLGYQAQSWIANALGTAVFITPVSVLLFYAGTDNRVCSWKRFLAKAGGWFLWICWVAGGLATLATT